MKKILKFLIVFLIISILFITNQQIITFADNDDFDEEIIEPIEDSVSKEAKPRPGTTDDDGEEIIEPIEDSVSKEAKPRPGTTDDDGEEIIEPIEDSVSKEAKSATNVNPTIAYARIDTNGILIIHIKNMKTKPEIFINDKKVNAKAVGQYTFEVVDKTLINTTAKITLKFSKSNIVSKNFYLSAGKSFNTEKNLNIDKNQSTNSNIKKVFTDGKNAYIYLNEDRMLYRYNMKSGECEFLFKGPDWRDIGRLLNYDGYTEKQYKSAKTIPSDFVVINGVIYTIFTFDFAGEKRYAMASLDTKIEYYPNISWTRIFNFPKECKLSMTTLGVYKGKIYVIGGYDENKNTISKNVYEYNIETKKWTKKDNLPGVRFAATANQVGDKLVLSFGGKSDGKVPCNLIYDGKTWKKSKASINVKTSTGTINGKKYYKPSVGLVSGGLIYSGINAEKLGNTFFYDIATDSYKKSGYKIDNINKSIGVAIGNKYYTFYKEQKEATISVKSIPVKLGFSKLIVRYPTTGIKASVNSDLQSKTDKNGNSYNTYYYLPGDIVNFKLSYMPGYYYNHFKVDDKEIEGYIYKGNIGAKKEIKVTIDKTENVVKINKKVANVSCFSTFQLKATYYNENITPMKWNTKDTNVIKVSSSGKVVPYLSDYEESAIVTGSSKLNGRDIKVNTRINVILPEIAYVKITKKTKNSITLWWPKLEGADGYQVNTFRERGHVYKDYERINNNTYTITNIDTTEGYYIGVRAYKKQGDVEIETYSTYVGD